MAPTPTKNLPVPTVETAEYWAGCRRRELLIQKCADCGHHQFYPRILCEACGGRSLAWVTASGRGTVTSYTIVRRAVSEAYAPDVPYVVALIRLAEGPTMMSNVVACPADQVRVGMPVEVTFEAWSDTVTMPLFRPSN